MGSMGLPKMLRYRMIWLIKRDLILTAKGGEGMSKFREKLDKVLDDVRSGICPVKTAKAIHLIAHRIVTDKYAECRQVEFGTRRAIMANLVQAAEDATV